MSVVASRAGNQHAPVMVSLLRYVMRAPITARPAGKCKVVTWLHFAVWGVGDGADGCGLASFLRWLDNLLRMGGGVVDQGNWRRGDTQRNGGGEYYGADESGSGAAEEEVACEVHGYGLLYFFLFFVLLTSST